MGKKVKITLTVEASSLYALSNPTQNEVDSKCELSDNNNGKSNGSIEDFQSNVYLNHDVKWIGKTNDHGYSVAIDSIVYENDSNDVNFFDDTTLNGSGGRDGNVKSKVKNDTALVGKIDSFRINFKVYKSKTESKPYNIDPKLKANN